MKIPGEAAERVARSLLEVGPATAAELAIRLELTAAGVRRPLAALVEAGLVAALDRPPYGPIPVRRRGRPSQVFTLTQAGRDALNQAYDELALEVLDFVARTQGEAGIRAFAAERAARLVQVLPRRTDDPVNAVVTVLTDAGYSPSVTTLADDALGEHVVQLCQHHCPVVDAAAAYPALCEAETTALGSALGRHVTRLATLAHGDGICTAVISASELGDDEHARTAARLQHAAPVRHAPVRKATA